VTSVVILNNYYALLCPEQEDISQLCVLSNLIAALLNPTYTHTTHTTHIHIIHIHTHYTYTPTPHYTIYTGVCVCVCVCVCVRACDQICEKVLFHTFDILANKIL